MFSLQLRSLGVMALGLAFSFAAVAAEGDKPQAGDQDGAKKEVKVQTTCPVMGNKINKDIYVDHDGKRVYLCCKACVAAFNKDPGKYIKKLEDEGVTIEKAPVQTECKDKCDAKDGKAGGGCCSDAGKTVKEGAGEGGCCK